MNKINLSDININVGDELIIKYVGRVKESFNPKDLKRLFGWVKDEEYKCKVRVNEEGEKLCDLYYRQTGKFNCTHYLGNIKIEIKQCTVKLIRVMHQTKLFE